MRTGGARSIPRLLLHRGNQPSFHQQTPATTPVLSCASCFERSTEIQSNGPPVGWHVRAGPWLSFCSSSAYTSQVLYKWTVGRGAPHWTEDGGRSPNLSFLTSKMRTLITRMCSDSWEALTRKALCKKDLASSKALRDTLALLLPRGTLEVHRAPGSGGQMTLSRISGELGGDGGNA